MTATIETKISMAIQARVASLPGSFPVLWTDDAPVEPPKDAKGPLPYVESHLEYNRTVRRFLGSTDPHERPGLLLLTLCWPLADMQKTPTNPYPKHKDAIRQHAGEVAGHFPADLAMDFQGVRVRVTAAPSVLGAYRDDHYLRTQVRIEWQAFA